MHFLSTYGMFLLKAVTIVVAILIVLSSIASLFIKEKSKQSGKIIIKRLNQHYDDLRHSLQEQILSKKAYKKLVKASSKKHDKHNINERLFVLDFNGDMKASAVTKFREEITALLTILSDKDKVLVRLESPGGLVNAYGLAASQLQRLRDHQIPLTVAVDKVAASGGYMMACVANTIIAAPFAIIGSIGVVSQLPNFNRWLKNHNIDFEQITAGEYKRTLTMFGENTDKDRQKAQKDVDDIHVLFKDFVSQHRSQLDLQQVATGEYWFGTRALELQLIDALQTSDDYLLEASKNHDIFLLSTKKSKNLLKRFSEAAQQTWQKVI